MVASSLSLLFATLITTKDIKMIIVFDFIVIIVVVVVVVVVVIHFN